MLDSLSLGLPFDEVLLFGHGCENSLFLLARKRLELLLHFFKLVAFSADPAELED